MPVIELKDVSKLYGFGDATTVALDEVNFSVEKGEFVAIMGPSGSGKSTLLNIIGLLDKPTHGTYDLGGRRVERMRANRRSKIRRDTIGFIFQSFNLLPRLNVLENVALPLAYKGKTQTKRLKQAGAILEEVGLADREYFMPKQLSGGQTQRVAIARALVNNPKIIIADEPTGNLDSASSLVIMELLDKIHRDGNTILMVTHNPELTKYASRVVFMHDGSIVADEMSKFGEIPGFIKRRMYSVKIKTQEDKLKGVSAVMKAIPDKNTKNDDSSNKKQKKPIKKYKRKNKAKK
ncbi:ABC transporter ATP-binding protein [Candidatus Saccharibacteria bacterium]|nr:ABC transporter ATP-binding protein [Candidatus Saccharibacteria bacterium]